MTRFAIRSAAAQLATATVRDGRRVEVAWEGGDCTELWSYWLRVQGAEAGLFEGTAAAWTDGANFHPQQEVASGRERIVRAAVTDGGEGLLVAWSDGREHRFEAAELRAAIDGDPAERVEKVPWTGERDWPAWDYEAIAGGDQPDELRDFLEHYLRYGVVFLEGAPRDELALQRLAGAIARVEPSHLGDRFHLRLRPDPKHIGEVRAGIPMHIDLVYRQRPPAIQALHALEQIGAGGENELVDAYALVGQLDPADVHLLATTPVEFVARSSAVHFRGRHPILQFRADGTFVGTAYNQYKIVFPLDAAEDFYLAFERFRALMHDPRNVSAFLIPQDGIVMFDNRRVLHGRRPFGDARRHVIGCFLDDDDLRSNYRLLCERRDAR